MPEFVLHGDHVRIGVDVKHVPFGADPDAIEAEEAQIRTATSEPSF